MELRQLKYFVALYEKRNMTKTANSLFITQQALSKSMHNLSEELGVTLFRKTSKGIEPTEYAQWLLPSAKKMIRLEEDILQSIQEIKNAEFKTFRIGYLFGSYNSYGALSIRIIQKLQNEFPHINFQIEEFDNPPKIAELVRKGDIHLGYAVNIQDEPGITILRVFDEPHCALVRKDSALAKKDSLEVKDLTGYEYFGWREKPIKGVGIDFLEEQIAPFRRTYVSGSIVNLIDYIRLNEGYAVAGKAFFQNYNLEGLKLLPIIDMPYLSHSYILNKDWKSLPQAAISIIETIRQLTMLENG